MDLGNHIKQLRKSKNLTAVQLATMVGITREHLSAVENNIKPISLSTLEKVCDVLGVTLTEFFADESDLSPELSQLLRTAKTLTPEQLKMLNDFIESLIKKED